MNPYADLLEFKMQEKEGVPFAHLHRRRLTDFLWSMPIEIRRIFINFE